MSSGPFIDVNETKRQAYLEAMGVRLVYPTHVLAGAKASPAYDFVEAETMPIEPESAAEMEAVPALREEVAIEHAPAPPEPVAVETVMDEPPSESPEPASEGTQPDADPLRFDLRYYRINERLAVIDELPYRQAGSVMADTVNLLKNILLALQVDASQCEFTGESFHWPLDAELDVDAEPAAAAKQALKGFITMRRQQDGFDNLLVFAGQIEELLLDAGEQATSRDFQAGDADYFLTVTSSLQSMLVLPLLKRDVWKQLQTLRQRLAS